MNSTTYYITIALVVCIGLFGLLAVGGSIYGILVWYPRYRQRKVDALKAGDRQGEATILQGPNHRLGGYRRAVFTLVPIRWEIRVLGLDTYEVDKNVHHPNPRAGSP